MKRTARVTVTRKVVGVMRHWLIAGCLGLLAVPLASCGDDDDGEGTAEECPQPGGLDDGCMCSPSQPLGLRRCRDDMTWSACECGAPIEQPCERGEIVECTCPGDSTVHTTECLGQGTYDCDCGETGGASGNGDD